MFCQKSICFCRFIVEPPQGEEAYGEDLHARQAPAQDPLERSPFKICDSQTSLPFMNSPQDMEVPNFAFPQGNIPRPPVGPILEIPETPPADSRALREMKGDVPPQTNHILLKTSPPVVWSVYNAEGSASAIDQINAVFSKGKALKDQTLVEFIMRNVRNQSREHFLGRLDLQGADKLYFDLLYQNLSR